MPSRDRRARGESDYLLTLKPDVKRDLEQLADRAGVPLSVAFREGAREWLLDRIEATAPTVAGAWRH